MSESMLSMADGDLADILLDPTGPAEDVALLPEGGETALSLRAVFDLATQDVAPGSRVPVISRRPMLALRHAEVYGLLGRALTKKDRFVVRGRTYRVETPEPDGMGGLAVKLLESGA